MFFGEMKNLYMSGEQQSMEEAVPRLILSNFGLRM